MSLNFFVPTEKETEKLRLCQLEYRKDVCCVNLLLATIEQHKYLTLSSSHSKTSLFELVPKHSLIRF